MDNANTLNISYILCGKTGRVALTAEVAGATTKVFKVDIIDEAAREKAKMNIQNSFPALKRPDMAVELAGKLLEISKQVFGDLSKSDQPSPTNDQGEELSSEELLEAIPEKVRKEVELMLTDPNLVQRIIEDIAALGVAGETELTATIYLIGTSRLTDQPLAGIVQGPSSSGKSYPIDRVADLFPPETVIRATHLTPQCLYYMRPDSLTHRFIVAGERSRRQDDDAAEATRALREMLSSGKLSKMLPVKQNDGGQPITELITQDGPIAYIESTTAAKIFDEDANRCIILQTDERAKQTRRVYRVVAARYSGTYWNIDTNQIIQRHHALQRMLKPYFVVIPYANALAQALPASRVEGRRAIGHLMGMIEVITLLHQCQRPTDANGRLLASADDYLVAKRLLDRSMARLLGGRISDAAQRFYDRLKDLDLEERFTTHTVSTRESATERAVRGWLSELYSGGYIECVEPHRGSKPAVWRLALSAPSDDTVADLPGIEEVLSQEGFRLSDKAQAIDSQEVASETTRIVGKLPANPSAG